VVAHLGQASGGYAELAVAAVESLHRVPDEVDEDVAVAMIGTGRTAVGLLEVAQLDATDVVVVTAAAGGLGALFVQAARDVGATSVALAGGPAKVARVAALGADIAVDYTAPGWPDEARRRLAGRPATLLLDGVGGPAARAAAGLLGRGGRVVVFGWSSGEPLSFSEDELARLGLRLEEPLGPRLVSGPGGLRGLEERAMAALAAGRLVPLVGQRFPLVGAADAHVAVAGRGTVGKTVLVP
jgi:NADPH2:quinone reductase